MIPCYSFHYVIITVAIEVAADEEIDAAGLPLLMLLLLVRLERQRSTRG